jgi:transcriptional/translational regulatory protein YebC/TACO1
MKSAIAPGRAAMEKFLDMLDDVEDAQNVYHVAEY